MTSEAAGWRPRPSHAVMVGLVVIVALTSAIGFDNGPIYDDRHVLEGGVIDQPKLALEALRSRTMFISRAGKSTPPDVDTYRPIPAVSFFLNAAISGRRLWSYHLLNALLHATCTVLLFAFVRRVIGRGKIKAAGLGALAFAVHPWLGEAHAWINGRSDPFALAFGLGAALVFLRRKTTPLRLLGGGALFFCGLASKETLLVTIPAFLFLEGARTVTLRERLLRVGALVAAAAVYLAIRLRVLEGMKTHRDAEMLKTAASRGPALVFDALYRLIVPEAPFLRSLRDDFAGVSNAVLVLATVGLVLLAGAAFMTRKKLASGPFALLFFVGSIAPVAGITTQLWPGFGRYLYLPAAALTLALVELAVQLVPRIRSANAKKVLAALFGVYLLTNMVLLVSFVRDMGSNESFYMTATEHRPRQAYGWGFLGIHYLSVGDDEPGIGALKRAMEIDPLEHRYRADLSLVLVKKGRCSEAVPIAARGLERYASTSYGAVFHSVLARCAPNVELAVRNLHLCVLLELDPEIDDCAKGLRDLVTKDPAARAALRSAMKTVPKASFDQEWSSLVSEP